MYKKILKQAYNNHAHDRDKMEMADWKFQEREQFLNRLKTENCHNILEIGAGPGRDSLYFQQSGLQVTCIDLSEEMVKLCREKGLNAHCMDFYHLDFSPTSFDAVYAMNCLLHVPKPQLTDVLAQIFHVLKPEGLFFCGVYGGQNTEGIWEADTYEPKRFFAMYEDEVLLEILGKKFQVIDFHTVDLGKGTPHFQSFTLRK
jgi:2-polyprenyl-3-methyl-5-hydroxy-6-metoxy-1,4-benzoquinol methylase